MKKSQVASIICAMSDKPTPYPSRTADQFIVRFPDGMRDRLKEAAQANGRSMNAEIVARLQDSFEGITIHGLDEDGLLKIRDMVIKALYADFVKRGSGDPDKPPD